ncbi:nitrogenase-stabilizing/protective protein NifW [Dolichospermum circinale]|jgi:nitrogenase-stabilizing/protective protein|uniref:nitrogenase-stabilizing/protective protein NifW n=1 Tax=Dolichospermum circinale TaxID=109265 RepID=UPI0004032749|nr:nitrogenase-stabilizing/protective protein NifW [Dolichospermum circinale]MCE2719721.1 nitrogenase-stabilizing/protective protein NifW [Anabaena sp. 49628_E55]MDB9481715.1 nitrogenase-stabilizing/protective protein NifW [Dolichospermum circinale CS-537/05]MDB9453339.1 nitrogenase-stabilizing/protective protein NifW [Dolichospermum circinale CS-541/06]MDB9463569.1 nitrogenase-stabilizing/protective protein NifW [Dolichospermum circinale CS-541/04]MDB9475532.1 nitrogenase-stabilizing/protecti
MSTNIDEFKNLVDAEEFFIFFNLPYDQKFVNVNRLHILKKFSQFMSQIDDSYPQLNDQERLEKYCVALQQAYQVFIESTPHEQKLFKVFNDKPKNVVTLTEITSD